MAKFQKLRRKVFIYIASIFGFVLINIIYFTCKKKLYLNTNLDEIQTPALFLSWHGNILGVVFLYMFILKKYKFSAMISNNKDGEIIARIASFYKTKTIRGSSSKGSIRALKEAFLTLDQKINIFITPDGPRGPRYSVANGAIALAQKKQIPIIAINFKSSSFWQFKSWDKMTLPKPFSDINFYLSEPFFINKMSQDEAKEYIKSRLMQNES